MIRDVYAFFLSLFAYLLSDDAYQWLIVSSFMLRGIFDIVEKMLKLKVCQKDIYMFRMVQNLAWNMSEWWCGWEAACVYVRQQIFSTVSSLVANYMPCCMRVWYISFCDDLFVVADSLWSSGLRCTGWSRRRKLWLWPTSRVSWSRWLHTVHENRKKTMAVLWVNNCVPNIVVVILVKLILGMKVLTPVRLWSTCTTALNSIHI